MFSCCRCTSSAKKDKKCKKIDTDSIDEDEHDKSELNNTDNKNIIEIKLRDDESDKVDDKKENQESPININTSIDEGIDNNATSNINDESYNININNIKLEYNINNVDKKNSLNNYEDDTTIENFSNSISLRKTGINYLDNSINQNLINGLDKYNNINNSYGATATNSSNNTNIDELEDNFYIIYSNDDIQKSSCMSRRSSSKSSFKKRVNINDSTEVIPSSDIASIIDDDEVFSDSIPPKIPRGDMCAPYIPIKRSSIQEHVEYLPDWFNEERFYVENSGVLEPPVTPVGRDELALKRHRLYSHLLKAAQAAVDHRVRFDPLGPQFAENPIDCDPDIKPSISKELEHLVNRLERLVERLERSISARELEIANKTFNSVVETKRRSFDIEAAELPPIPSELPTKKLNKRIEILEDSFNKINDSYNSSKKDSPPFLEGEGSLENIPTVLDEFLIEDFLQPIEELSASDNMSVNGYQDIVSGPLVQYINLSNKIGGDVAKHAQFVKQAFDAQLQYITLATQCAQPPQNKQMELLKPTSDQITAIQTFREKNRTSPYFNHLSAVSESIPALGWVCVSPTPGPHVKEMNDAGQFYTNRVLKDWKEKDATHVEWARAWIQTLTQLQQFIKQWHTTGLVWSGKGAASGGPPPPPSALGCPPPPPPPVLDMSDLQINATGDDRSALFAEINKGADITKGLKKVTSDMQTHKNPTLRTGPAPFKAPGSSGSVGGSTAPVNKSPVFNKDGKKWLIEYQKSNPSLLIENTEMNNVVYMFKCENSTLTVKGKINSVVMDSCKKCSLLFDSVVASIEFVNCQGIQMQVLQKCPTISIDKTDGCQMYLSKDSLDVEIVSSKSSEMNVLIPKANGEYTEQPIPEQFKTVIKGNTIHTTCVDSLG